MKQVKIISGIYGHKPQGSRFVQPIRAGEVVTVTNEEAARLIGLSVAIYTDKSVREGPAGSVATPREGRDDGGAGETMPEGGNGTEGQEAGTLPEITATLDIVDGHFTTESLLELTRPNMEQLAADLGINVSSCKNKPEIAALLAGVEIEASEPEDGETPPDLGAAPPVV